MKKVIYQVEFQDPNFSELDFENSYTTNHLHINQNQLKNQINAVLNYEKHYETDFIMPNCKVIIMADLLDDIGQNVDSFSVEAYCDNKGGLKW